MEILAGCLRDLEAIFPGRAARVTGHAVFRHPHGYPVSTPGAFARLAALHRDLDGRGLQLAGDGVIYPTFEAAVESGALAAERIEDFLS